MSFIETPRFPDSIATWAVGGRGFQTSIVATFGGDEYRNADWDQPLGAWQIDFDRKVGTAAATANTIAEFVRWLRVCKGRVGRFRFKDFTDFNDDGAGILGLTGLAVAATLTYQMYKGYAISPASHLQIIQKPLATGITIYDNGVAVPQPAGCTYNSATGIVTFVSQPTVGHALTWKGDFDIPCRFNTDMPQVGFDDSGALISTHQLIILETRDIS